MSKRRQMKDNYRRFSFLSDIEGMKNAIGEMHGMFFPPQPFLNQDAYRSDQHPVPDEEWFIRTIQDKIARHPDNRMEYPFFGETIFEAPLVGFVCGDDPIFDRLKKLSDPTISPLGRSCAGRQKRTVFNRRNRKISVWSLLSCHLRKTRGGTMPPLLHGRRRDGRSRAYWAKSSARSSCVRS